MGDEITATVVEEMRGLRHELRSCLEMLQHIERRQDPRLMRLMRKFDSRFFLKTRFTKRAIRMLNKSRSKNKSIN